MLIAARIADRAKKTIATANQRRVRLSLEIADATILFGHVAKWAWLRCAATRRALAATVKLGFRPALEGKKEVSTT